MDRKEELLIAFAAASFRSIYKGLDGTILLSVPTAVAREVYYPIAGATFCLRVGTLSSIEMVWGQRTDTLLGMGKQLLRFLTLTILYYTILYKEGADLIIQLHHCWSVYENLEWTVSSLMVQSSSFSASRLD
jgi:hypothetical protein